MGKRIMTNRMAELAVFRKEKREGIGGDQAIMLHQAIQGLNARPFTAEDARRAFRPKERKEEEAV